MASNTNVIKYELQVVDNVSPAFIKVEDSAKKAILTTARVSESLDKLQKVKVDDKDIVSLTNRLKELADVSKTAEQELERIKHTQILLSNPIGRQALPSSTTEDLLKLTSTGKLNTLISNQQVNALSKGTDIIQTQVNAEAKRLDSISKQLNKEYRDFYLSVKRSADEYLNKDVIQARANLTASRHPPKELFLANEQANKEAELAYTNTIKEQIAARVAARKQEIAINKEVEASLKATADRAKNLELVRRDMLRVEEAIKSGAIQNASLISDKELIQAKEYLNVLATIESRFKLSSSELGKGYFDKGASYLKARRDLEKYLKDEEIAYEKHIAKMRDYFTMAFSTNRRAGLGLGELSADNRPVAPYPSNINSQLGITPRSNTPLSTGTLQAVREQIDFENLVLKHGANSSIVIRRQMENELEAITKEGNAKILAADKHLIEMEKTGDNSRINAAIQNRNALYANYSQKLKDTEALHANSLATALNSERHVQNSEALITNGRASQHLLTRIFQFDIGYRIANNALNLFMNTLRSIPAVGIAWESANATFKAVFSTVENVNAQFAFLDDLANRTGASITVLREQFGQFASSAKFSGESIGKIQQIFNDITMAGTVLHLPADKLKSAFIAINQMYAKNQVMMEELKKQLGNQLPAAVAIFALSMGTSTRKLMEDMKKGLVLPKETIAKFAATYRDFFADTSSFAQAAKGLNAELGRLSSSWTYLSQAIYEDVSGLLTNSVRKASSLLLTIKDNLEAIGIATSIAFGIGATSFLSHYISKLALAAVTAETAGRAYKALALATTANFAAGSIGGANSALTALTAAGTSGTIFDKLKILLPDILANLTKFAKLVSVVGGVTLAIEGAINYTTKLGNVTVTGKDLIVSSWKDIKEAINSTFETYKINVDSLNPANWLNSIGHGWDMLLGGLANVGFTGISKNIGDKFLEGANKGLVAQVFADKINKVAADKLELDKIVAAQLASDKISAAIKDELIKGSEQGSEEMAALMQQKVSKYLETFNKLSDTINATADLQVKTGLHAIQLEQQAIEKDFKANRVSFLDYYETRVKLAEKEYEIVLKKSELEKGLAIYGLQETQKFKNLSNIEYSSIPMDKAQKIRADLSNIDFATAKGTNAAYGKAGIVLDDSSPNSFKNNQAIIALVNENLKAEQERINNIKKENLNKPIEQQQAISAQEEYILSLHEAAIFWKSDIETKRNTLAKFREETEKAQNKLSESLSSSILHIEDTLAKGIDSDAKVLADTSSRMQVLQSTEGRNTADQVIAIATKEGVNNVNAFLANVIAESNLKQKSISSVGAVGISQVMPSNTFAKGLDISTISGNVTAGSRYWKYLEQKYNNDLTKVAAAYNAGEGGVDKHNAQNTYPETINHVKRVTALSNKIGNLANRVPYAMSSISEEIGRPISAKYVSSQFKGESKVIQADVKALDAQYTKEKALEELENLRTEHFEKIRDAYTNSQIAVLKLSAGTELNVTKLENEIKYRKELEGLDKMQEAHNKLDLQAANAKTIAEKELIEAKRSKLIPLTKEEILLQEQNVRLLKYQSEELAKVAAIEAQRTNDNERISLSEKRIGLGESANQYGKFGAMQKRSALYQNEYARMSSDSYRTQEYGKIIAQSGGDTEKMKNGIDAFNLGLEETKQKGEELNNYFANEISNSIGTAMTDWALGNKNVEDSLKSLGVAFLKMVMDMIVQEIILTGVRLALKAATVAIFGGGAAEGGKISKANGGTIGYAMGGNILAFPSGGRVKGVGTETSDSNYAVVPKGSYIIKASSSNKLANKHGNMLVKLSNNETVIPPDMVNAYGKDFFDFANKNGELKFADGGSIGQANNKIVNFPKGNNTKINSASTNNIVVNVQSNGKETSTEMGQKISIEIVKQIAKAEAKREVNVNNKLNKVNSRRVA